MRDHNLRAQLLQLVGVIFFEALQLMCKLKTLVAFFIKEIKAVLSLWCGIWINVLKKVC